MSGYEVCQQLKTNERTCDIPVIFISALHGTLDKVKAFSFGAVDYITKPFQPEEVLARVETHLNLQQLRKDVEKKNAALQQEVAEHKRTAVELREVNQTLQELLDTLRQTQEKLIQSEKMAVLGSMIVGVAHELSTPLGVGIIAASYFEEQIIGLEQSYSTGQLKRSDLEQYLKNTREGSELILRNLHRTAEIVQQFKQVAVNQTTEPNQWFKLTTYIDDILLSPHSRLGQTSHKVTVNYDQDFEIYGDPNAFSQIITHLITNSLTHGFDKIEQGHILLDMTIEEEVLHLIYEDNGKGMNEEERHKIFDPFYTTKRAQGNTGLGLYIIYNIITQRLGGTIVCESSPDKGTRFLLQIPLNPRACKSSALSSSGMSV